MYKYECIYVNSHKNIDREPLSHLLLCVLCYMLIIFIKPEYRCCDKN